MRDFFHAPTLCDESQYLEGSRIGERSRTEQQLSRRILQVTPRARELMFGIAGAVGEGLKRLFMTHPPLEARIAALRNLDAPDDSGALARQGLL